MMFRVYVIALVAFIDACAIPLAERPFDHNAIIPEKYMTSHVSDPKCTHLTGRYFMAPEVVEINASGVVLAEKGIDRRKFFEAIPVGREEIRKTKRVISPTNNSAGGIMTFRVGPTGSINLSYPTLQLDKRLSYDFPAIGIRSICENGVIKFPEWSFFGGGMALNLTSTSDIQCGAPITC
jgi:hypothetical protein